MLVIWAVPYQGCAPPLPAYISLHAKILPDENGSNAAQLKNQSTDLGSAFKDYD